MSTLVNTPI